MTDYKIQIEENVENICTLYENKDDVIYDWRLSFHVAQERERERGIR